LDKPNLIFKNILEAVRSASAEGTSSAFPGFFVYEETPQREPIQFPCLMVMRGRPEEVEKYFGGGRYMMMTVEIQLGFLEKRNEVDETDLYEMEKLSYAYRDKLDNFYNTLTFTSSLNVGETDREITMVAPRDAMDEIWGATMVVAVGYEET
jgi:hypothetical protein